VALRSRSRCRGIVGYAALAVASLALFDAA
jgi:hypothetical protein